MPDGYRVLSLRSPGTVKQETPETRINIGVKSEFSHAARNTGGDERGVRANADCRARHGMPWQPEHAPPERAAGATRAGKENRRPGKAAGAASALDQPSA